MKKKLLILSLIIIYIALIISMIYYFITYNRDYVLFGTTTFVYFDNNNQIKRIKKVDNLNKRLNYEKFKIYYNGGFKDSYVNFYNEDNSTFYTIYDENYEKLHLNNYLLLYKGNIKVNVNISNIQTQISAEEEEKIMKLLKQEGLPQEIIMFSKQSIDLDNDSNIENIYMVNNYGSTSQNYTYIFIEESDKSIIDIDITKNKNKTDYLKKYYAWAIDLDDDKKFEIVLSQSAGDDSPVYYEFYKYNSSIKEVQQINK